MRCFVALGLEDAPGPALAPWLESTRALFSELGVSAAGNLHLTLAFLGDIGPEPVEAAGDAVRAGASGHHPWRLRWGSPGVFPSASRPRVLWLGVEATKPLEEAHQAVTQALAAAGLVLEDRAFRPHLTLVRVRRGSISRRRYEEIVAHLQTLPVVEPSRVVSLVLFQSQLGRGPAVHTPLVTAQLMEPGQAPPGAAGVARPEGLEPPAF